MQLDLTTLPERYLAALGREKLAEIVGQTENVVAMWIKRKKFPLDAVQKLLEFDPSPLAEIKPLYEAQDSGGKLIILMPSNGPVEPQAQESLMRLYNPATMAFKSVGFNNLPIARNALAAHFLNGPWQWAFWMDSDSVLPCGNAQWFKQVCGLNRLSDVYAGVNTILRLMAHNKTFVSCVYVSKSNDPSPQFAGGESHRADIRGGPRDEIKAVPAVGFGGVLTHRKMFEDIIASQGDEIRHASPYLKQRFGYDYSFFDPTTKETPGDDYPLCARAIRAGHQPFIDKAVFAGHVGRKIYTYADIR